MASATFIGRPVINHLAATKRNNLCQPKNPSHITLFLSGPGNKNGPKKEKMEAEKMSLLEKIAKIINLIL